jgi:pyruvate/2-oxoglutarate dehydrogenase complex dihydrolipoamide acyltransferase (E2) component
VIETLLFRNHNVDISVAVSTDSGLITPIVFSADKKVGISRIHRCLYSLLDADHQWTICIID